MQNENQINHAEYIINLAWKILSSVVHNTSINDAFMSALAGLYAYHKGYFVQPGGDFRYIAYSNNDPIMADLVSMIRIDKNLNNISTNIVRSLSSIDSYTFNTIYAQVLKGLFDLLASKTSRSIPDFFTPNAITKLLAYFVNRESCSSVFDPFCGSASIIGELSNSKDFVFEGQEINQFTSLYARIINEAYLGADDNIRSCDSVKYWNDKKFDAIVSCPPFGVKLNEYQTIHLECQLHNAPRSFEEILLARTLYTDQANLSVFLLPIGVCFLESRFYKLRKQLVERHMIDTIVSLPSNILYGTSIPTIVLVCKKDRNADAPITFIHLDNYLVDDRKRIFDFPRFLQMIEGDKCDCTEVSTEVIRKYDYNLNPAIYQKQIVDLKEGQSIRRLADLITLTKGEKVNTEILNNQKVSAYFGADFINILLYNGKLSNPAGKKYLYIQPSNDKFLLINKNNLYGLNTQEEGFLYASDVKIFKINESIVTPEYIVYILVNNEIFNKRGTSFTDFFNLPIVVDSLDRQKEIVNKEIQIYDEKKKAEQEADALRLGVKQNISDLEHMLGSTQLRINSIITRLENATPSSDNYQDLVKSMKDNVEYMNRLIKYNNSRIDTEFFNIQSSDIYNFIKEYADAWNNYGGGYFELEIENELYDSSLLNIDRTMLTVMLDSILGNAVRHSFHKRKNHTEKNKVSILLSLVSYNEKPYVLISIANNGDPFTEGFTIDDYISRGRYSASTGRSGLGGYHVYQIVKGHNGLLCLDKNNKWNVVIDILIPFESDKTNNMTEYAKECI